VTSSSTLRVAVVTGAACGIGLVTAHWFLNHGYQVALIALVNNASISGLRASTLRVGCGFNAAGVGLPTLRQAPQRKACVSNHCQR
jgi:NAD(P)-dependent dehydrogenase (short-subunit alcohol dehydrogenase family)